MIFGSQTLVHGGGTLEWDKYEQSYLFGAIPRRSAVVGRACGMPRKRCRGRQAGGGGAARRARKFPGPPRNLFSANRREPSRAIATVANRRELSQRITSRLLCRYRESDGVPPRKMSLHAENTWQHAATKWGSPSQTKHSRKLFLRYGGSAAVPPSQFSLHAERIERDQAGPSGIKREPKWGYPHSGSTLLARIPRALPAPAAPLPEFWGAL